MVRLTRRAIILIFLISLPGRATRAQEESVSQPGEQGTGSANTSEQPAKSRPRTPDWLYLAFETRLRYETLDNRFRLAETGSDQQLARRTRLRLGVKRVLDPFRFLVEIEDARISLNDEGSTITNQMMNENDFLQLYAGLAFKRTLRWNVPSTIYFGRQSFDLGSRRLVARNLYRNATNAFDGLRWTLGAEKAWQLHAFLLQPVRRRLHQLDRREEGAYLWGFFLSSHPRPAFAAEAYYFGLLEDPAALDSKKRRFATLGGRLWRNPQAGTFAYELESAWQVGKVGSLDHFAHFQHAALGYCFKARWHPALTFKYDYASGDRDPHDGSNGAFDTLFGARRFDYGPTGIYGPIYRSNINSPSITGVLNPTAKFQIMPSFRWLRLAQPRDCWVGSGLRDPSGKSGTDLGSHLEIRLRYNFTSYFRPEIGYLRFFKGSYEKGVSHSPPAGNSNYLFIELNFAWDPLLR